MNRKQSAHLVFAAALCLNLMACAHSLKADQASPRSVALMVHNSNTSDVNVYVVNGPMRVRLGTARSMSTSHLTIPAVFLTASSGVTIQADPIGSTATITFSAIQASPRDRVEISVGSAIHMSSFAVYTR